MKQPLVAIVGRQNVGKSTLFNRIIKERKAIVDSYPGLTRDVLTYNMEIDEKSFTLSDTPGLDLQESSQLSDSILSNAMDHLSQATVIIFLLEYPAPDSFDYELSSHLRKLGNNVIVAVNKMDSGEMMEQMADFYSLGYNDFIPISARKNININLLMERVHDLLPASGKAKKETDLSIAIVGRPNAGKSTLLNAYLGRQRAIVSDTPGTTRDSVDEEFIYHGKKIEVIDTAGIRKKSRFKDDHEFFSLDRTRNSIRKSDVVIHLLDASQGITDTDKKISDIIIEEHKPIVIALNKWDTISKDHKSFDEYKKKVISSYYRAADFPIISISAANKQRIQKLLETAMVLKERSTTRISTPVLNETTARFMAKSRIPQLVNSLRIYYLTQVETTPPTFKLFVNKKELFRKDTLRYIEKELQREFNLHGIPIKLKLEGKKEK
jgi:GTPase